MGLRFTRHIKLGKHLRLNISKSGVGISGGVKGARISYNPKTGVRESVGIPGTGIYYSEQHKVNSKSKGASNLRQSNIDVTNNGESLNVKDYNNKKLNAANNKLFKNCLKIFFGCLVLDAFTFKSVLIMEIVAVIEVVAYVGTFISMSKKIKECNRDGLKI